VLFDRKDVALELCRRRAGITYRNHILERLGGTSRRINPVSQGKEDKRDVGVKKGERAFIGLVDIIRKRVIGKRQEPRYATSLPAFREA
jgi:hypothetical protein